MVRIDFDRRRRCGLAALAGSTLLLLGGCNSEDPLYCCSTIESCQRNGGEPTIQVCTDPERPHCDDEGYFGLARTCVPDPGGQVCGTADECSSEAPACVDHLCVDCEDSSQCDPDAPTCDVATHECIGCQADTDCSAFVDAPRCLTGQGTCVACLEADDCGEGAPICADNTCVECAGPDDCSSPTPICSSNQCVQCTGPDDCTGAAPTCDANTCRGCAADSECASDACDEDGGTCFAEQAVIYLATTGIANGTCTRAEPCNSFARALTQVTAERNVIKAAPGTYEGQVEIEGITVTILADGATVHPPPNQSAVSVSDGADATIEGLTVTGTVGSGNTVAVTCTAALLRLRRSTVIANTGGGGVSISGCAFSLLNNVIAINGSPTSAFGGVQVSNIATEGVHEFSFNTVTGNVATANEITGVVCGLVAVPLTFSSNVVYDNLATGTGTQVGGDDQCAWTFSDIGPETIAGAGNINADPLFVAPDLESQDFHLQPTSPARNTADPESTLARDIDGDRRPAGERSDMGADEVTK